MAQVTPLVLDAEGDLSRVLAGDTLLPSTLGTGTADKNSVLQGDGAWGYKVNRGLRTILFGSSLYTRQFDTYSVAGGGITTTGSQIIVDTVTNCRVHKGMYVFLGSETGTTLFDQQHYFGPITIRNSNTRFRVARPSSFLQLTNTALWNVWVMDRFTAPAEFREINYRLGHPMKLIGSYSISGRDSTSHLSRIDAMLALNPDHILGDFGVWNDALGGNITNTLSNLTTMVEKCVRQNVRITFMSPPPVRVLDGALTALAFTVWEYVRQIAAKYKDIWLYDRFGFSVQPMIGFGPADLFQTDGIHSNHKSAVLQGLDFSLRMASAFESNIEPLVTSKLDRYAESTNSGQLYDGGWLATGVDASTIDTKCTGTLDAQMSIVTQGNTARSVVCSLEARPDGLGYDQVLVLTAAAANDRFTLTMPGAGNSLAARCALNTTYVCGGSLYVHGETAAVRTLGFYVESTHTYADASVGLSYYTAAFSQHGELTEPPLTEPVSGDYVMNEFRTVDEGTITTMLPTLFVAADGPGVIRVKIGRVTFRKTSP